MPTHYATPPRSRRPPQGGVVIDKNLLFARPHVLSAARVKRGIIAVTAGSLDDPSWFKPAMDIFTGDAQPWDIRDADLPEHREYPAK